MTKWIRNEVRYLREARQHRAVAICLALIVVLSVVGLVAIPAFAGEAIPREAHDAVVREVKQQVSMLRWVGGAIVTGLVTTIGLLWRSLERAHIQSREDWLRVLGKTAAGETPDEG